MEPLSAYVIEEVFILGVNDTFQVFLVVGIEKNGGLRGSCTGSHRMADGEVFTDQQGIFGNGAVADDILIRPEKGDEY
jgi:hypothetical protein